MSILESELSYPPKLSNRWGPLHSPEDEPDRLDSESPQHEVTVSPFYMGQTPITQAQWREIASLRPVNRTLNLEPSFFQGHDQPVESVSWDDAVEFCARLSRLTGRDYRLPSEAEWEYACRAGTITAYSFGDNINETLANYDSNIGETTPVDKYPANRFGLYDMHGNVYEWCADYWHDNYENSPTDGRAWLTENDGIILKRTLRGGSWDLFPWYCRSATRNFRTAGVRLLDNGLRVRAY